MRRRSEDGACSPSEDSHAHTNQPVIALKLGIGAEDIRLPKTMMDGTQLGSDSYAAQGTHESVI